MYQEENIMVAGTDADVTDVREPVRQRFVMDENYNPSGGMTSGPGFHIVWPSIDEPHSMSGRAFLTEVIDGLSGRLTFYQTTQFKCAANSVAIYFLRAAKLVLEERIAERKARGVHNTHNI